MGWTVRDATQRFGRDCCKSGRVAFADFNKDGKSDLAVPSGFGFSILLGNGAADLRRELTSRQPTQVQSERRI